MKRLETELEENYYNLFEKLCEEEDISMRKKTRQLITRAVILHKTKKQKQKNGK